MAKKEKDLSQLFASSINMCRPKKDGSGTFMWTTGSSNLQSDVRYVLLTGNDPYDTFVGGFPFGHISEVFGLENCGKTALMIRSMCRFQAKHIYEVTETKGFTPTFRRVDPKNVRLIKAYLDNEGSLQNNFKLTIHDVSYNEQGEEVVEKTSLDLETTAMGLCDTVEQIFQSIDKFLDIIKKVEDENEDIPEDEREVVFGVFIVDTVAGTSSKDEMERDWGERDYPRAAGKISEGFRRLRGEIERRNVALICTNQVRTQFKEHSGGGHQARFSTPQEGDFSTYGGKALHFYAAHRIFMFRLPIKYTLVKGAQFPAGYLVGFRTHKNRLRKGGREGRMVLLFDEEQGGLHNQLSLLESMIYLRVAEQGDDGSVRFLFRKYGLETTTFAENVKLGEEAATGRSRRKVTDPEIDGRYQWLGFYKAHRPDLDKLWQVAIDRANLTEGLDGHLNNEGGEDADPESSPERRAPATGRKAARSSVPTLEDEDNK